MFYVRDVYPNFGRIDTADKTIPDPAEQGVYQAVQARSKAPVWVLILVGIVLIIAFTNR